MSVQRKAFASREEWLQHRASYIGGSDAAAILGLSPYMSNVELWEIKTGRRKQADISQEPYVLYGTNAEQYLRELYKLDFPEYEVCYEENNMWLNEKYPFAHASLDGWLIEKGTGRKGIWECKTTNIINSIMRQKWKKRIPDQYYCQVLHYLMVTEFDFVNLKAQLKYTRNGEIWLETKHYHIEIADVEDDIAYLAEKEKEFTELIQTGRRPNLVLPNI